MKHKNIKLLFVKKKGIFKFLKCVKKKYSINMILTKIFIINKMISTKILLNYYIIFSHT